MDDGDRLPPDNSFWDRCSLTAPEYRPGESFIPTLKHSSRTQWQNGPEWIRDYEPLAAEEIEWIHEWLATDSSATLESKLSTPASNRSFIPKPTIVLDDQTPKKPQTRAEDRISSGKKQKPKGETGS